MISRPAGRLLSDAPRGRRASADRSACARSGNRERRACRVESPGPAADIIRNQRLPQSTVDWLKSNFLKTELELGHCLRLPEEGPCECDLYLNCAKFVTTRSYAPRLRARHRLELNLTEDARCRGWTREIERHSGIASRIEQLLVELGEPVLDAAQEVGQTPEAARKMSR